MAVPASRPSVVTGADEVRVDRPSAYVSLERIGPLVMLVGTVAFAAVFHAILAVQSPAPWIVPDELRYAELAKSLAAEGAPQIRGETTFAFGLTYPAVLAPLWAVFESAHSAYVAAKVLNAFLISLTAIPVYWLARRFVDRASAAAAAALSICVPSLLYAGTIMTEVALYPASALALAAIAAALDRPTRTAQAAALASIALACSIKVRSLALVAGYVAAVVLFSWLEERTGRARARRLALYAPSWIVLGAAVVGGLALTMGRGESPTVVLGAYGGIVREVDVAAAPLWALRHAAEFDLYVAVVPFAAALLVVGRGLRASAPRRTRLLAAQTLALAVAVLAIAAVNSAHTGVSAHGYASGAGASERQTFVLAPLAFVALMVVLADRRGRRKALVLALLLAALMPAAIPLDRFSGNVTFQAFALVPWVTAGQLAYWPLGAIVLGAALALVFVLSMRPGTHHAFAVAPVAVVLLSYTVIAQPAMETWSTRSARAGFGGAPDWIDRAVGHGEVSVVWYERPGSRFVNEYRQRVVWLNEFFNRSVGTVYEVGSPSAYLGELRSMPARLRGGRLVLANGDPAALSTFVLVPCHVRATGSVVARDGRTGAAVYRVRPDVRFAVARPGRCLPR